jgi:hypothetical protein
MFFILVYLFFPRCFILKKKHPQARPSEAHRPAQPSAGARASASTGGTPTSRRHPSLSRSLSPSFFFPFFFFFLSSCSSREETEQKIAMPPVSAISGIRSPKLPPAPRICPINTWPAPLPIPFENPRPKPTIPHAVFVPISATEAFSSDECIIGEPPRDPSLCSLIPLTFRHLFDMISAPRFDRSHHLKLATPPEFTQSTRVYADARSIPTSPRLTINRKSDALVAPHLLDITVDAAIDQSPAAHRPLLLCLACFLSVSTNPLLCSLVCFFFSLDRNVVLD